MITKTEEVVIKPLKMNEVAIRIVGDSPLIVHAWSEKAKKMMLDAQMGKSKGKAKDLKNPVEDFIGAAYWLSEKPTEMTEDGFANAIKNGARFGFPVTAFKQAAISAAYRMGWSKDKVSLKSAFFIKSVNGDMAEIESDIPVMREDMVRVGMGTADIRYRPEFRNWSTVLVIEYDENGKLSFENILTMLNAGGKVNGVGEWRPEKDGIFGTFHVEPV